MVLILKCSDVDHMVVVMMISLKKQLYDGDPIPMISQVCPRIVFRTASRKISDLLEESHPYNQVKFIMIIILLMILVLMITVG